MNKNFRFTVCLAMIVIAGWYVASTNAANKKITYDIPTTIAIDEHKSDTVRVVDAYERLMERYMYMVEQNMGFVASDVKEVQAKMDSIDNKLDQINNRLGRIEKALNIEQPRKKQPQKKSIEEFLKEK